MKAQFCSECGAALDEKGRCQNPACVNHASSNPPKGQHTANLSDPKKPVSFSEKDKMIVPDCIQSDQDEVPIKQYDLARLQTLIKWAFAEGRLQVTNKRVLFRSSGTSLFGPTCLQHEFSIEEIAGIEIRKESRFNFTSTLILLILSAVIFYFCHPVFAHIYNSNFIGTLFILLLAAASVFVFFLLKKRNIIRHLILSLFFSGLPFTTSGAMSVFLGQSNKLRDLGSLIILIVFLINVLFLAFAPNLVVSIKTKGGTPSVEIRRKDGFFSFQHNEYTGFSQVQPGPDTDLAMRELGAVIREVQQTGAYAEN